MESGIVTGNSSYVLVQWCQNHFCGFVVNYITRYFKAHNGISRCGKWVQLVQCRHSRCLSATIMLSPQYSKNAGSFMDEQIQFVIIYRIYAAQAGTSNHLIIPYTTKRPALLLTRSIYSMDNQTCLRPPPFGKAEMISYNQLMCWNRWYVVQTGAKTKFRHLFWAKGLVKGSTSYHGHRI